MPTFVKAFLFLMGLGLVAVGVQGIFKRQLPAGGNNSPPVSRDRSPVMFWAVFCIYIGMGTAMCLYAIGLLPWKAG